MCSCLILFWYQLSESSSKFHKYCEKSGQKPRNELVSTWYQVEPYHFEKNFTLILWHAITGSIDLPLMQNQLKNRWGQQTMLSTGFWFLDDTKVRWKIKILPIITKKCNFLTFNHTRMIIDQILISICIDGSFGCFFVDQLQHFLFSN